MSDLITATVAEFGSISGEILRHVPTLAEIAAMTPTEVLPCSMSSLQDNPSAAQYGCTPATHAQHEYVSTPVFQPPNEAIGEAGHQAADPVEAVVHPNPDSCAVAASTQAEWQLPLPARRAWHSLTSLLLTLKLAAFTSTDVVGPLIWRTIFAMKEDLAVGLSASAEYSRQSHSASTAAGEAGQQAQLSSSRTQTAQDILLLSDHVITLVVAFLRRAVKELSRGEKSMGTAMAVACMGLVAVLLKHGPPAAGDKLFTAGACSCLCCTMCSHTASG